MDGAPDRGDSDPSKLKFHYGSIGIVLEINAGRSSSVLSDKILPKEPITIPWRLVIRYETARPNVTPEQEI
jgi:hypothetical protein